MGEKSCRCPADHSLIWGLSKTPLKAASKTLMAAREDTDGSGTTLTVCGPL
jgi:hypothetical protein